MGSVSDFLHRVRRLAFRYYSDLQCVCAWSAVNDFLPQIPLAEIDCCVAFYLQLVKSNFFLLLFFSVFRSECAM